MANDIGKRDDNRQVVLMGVTDDASADIKRLLIDPATGRLKCSATISSNLDDLADVIITSAGTADIIYYSGTAWVNLPAGISGQILQTNGTASAPSWATAGSGDVVGPASSVNNEIVLFDSTTGKLIKRATGSGLLRATSGVYGTTTIVTADIDND